MRYRYNRDDDLNCRVLNYLESGNIAMMKKLFEIGFLRHDDTFDTTGSGIRGNPEDSDTMMSIIARNEIPNYKNLIDILLDYGADINNGQTCTPLQTAIIYQNYATAAYMMIKGGEYDIDQVKNYSMTEISKEYDILITNNANLLYGE
jgi:hypothetical protein